MQSRQQVERAVESASVGAAWPAPRPARPAARLAEEECARLRAALAAAVRRVCPRWLSAQADDIVQAALLRVLAVHDGRPLAPAYLWRAAYTATVDEIRRQRRRRETRLDDAEAEAPARAPGDDPDRAARAHEIGHGLQDCLRRLLIHIGLAEPLATPTSVRMKRIALL